jgi:hypothetical protein
VVHSATVEPTEQFSTSLAGLSEGRAKSALKALRLFKQNTRHRSLNFHKLDGLPPYCSIWTGNDGDRILLKRVEGGHYLLIEVGSHDFVYRVAKNLSR